MKSLKSKILTGILSATMLFSAVGFSACGNGEQASKLAELELKLLQQQTQIADIAQEKEDLAEELTAQIENLEEENEDLQTELEEMKQENESLKKFNQSLIPTEGKLLSLKEAYAYGLLTKEDLLSIAYYNNYNSNFGNEEIMPEDFVPQPKITLNEEIEGSIKEAIKQDRKKGNDYKDKIIFDGVIVEDPVNLTGYYGTYNNCVAFSCASGGLTVESMEIINNIKFYYSMPNDYIIIWVNKRFKF